MHHGGKLGILDFFLLIDSQIISNSASIAKYQVAFFIGEDKVTGIRRRRKAGPASKC